MLEKQVGARLGEKEKEHRENAVLRENDEKKEGQENKRRILEREAAMAKETAAEVERKNAKLREETEEQAQRRRAEMEQRCAAEGLTRELNEKIAQLERRLGDRELSEQEKEGEIERKIERER